VDVEDNGPGVAGEIAGDIFNPFFSTKGSGGTGLGLAVTQKIVHEHRGTISVGRSDLGGAAFHVVIPPRNSEADHVSAHGIESPTRSE
jgi:signal transduction histidine kinase